MSQDFSFLLCLALAIHKYATIERIGHGNVIKHVNSLESEKNIYKNGHNIFEDVSLRSQNISDCSFVFGNAQSPTGNIPIRMCSKNQKYLHPSEIRCNLHKILIPNRVQKYFFVKDPWLLKVSVDRSHK